MPPGKSQHEIPVLYRLVSHQHDARNPLDSVGVLLKGWIPEVFRIVLLAGGKMDIGC